MSEITQLCDCFSFICNEDAPPTISPELADDIICVKSFASENGIPMVIADFPFTYKGMHEALMQADGLYACYLGDLHTWCWVRCIHGRIHLANWFPDGADNAFKVKPGEVKAFRRLRKTGKTRPGIHWTEKLVRRFRALTPGRYFVILSISKESCDWTVVEAGKVER